MLDVLGGDEVDSLVKAIVGDDGREVQALIGETGRGLFEIEGDRRHPGCDGLGGGHRHLGDDVHGRGNAGTCVTDRPN